MTTIMEQTLNYIRAREKEGYDFMARLLNARYGTNYNESDICFIGFSDDLKRLQIVIVNHEVIYELIPKTILVQRFLEKYPDLFYKPQSHHFWEEL